MNTGKLKQILIFITACLAAVSCEEVIDVDLNSRSPEIVVEGVIARDSTCIVKLSMTTDYFDTAYEIPVTDATVNLTSDQGEEETLVHEGNGYYLGSKLKGKVGANYILNINPGAETITGESYLPEPVEIISTEGRESPFSRPGDDPGYVLDIKFTDNPETDNFYMVRVYRNDTIMTGNIGLASNEYNLSGVIEYTEWMYDFRVGDSATVEVYSIDNNLYSYFTMLNEVTSFGINFSTPYNPRSNLSGNTLGYFGSWALVSDSTVIK